MFDEELIKATLIVHPGQKAYLLSEGDFYSNYIPYVQEYTISEISWKLDSSGKDLGFAAISNSHRYTPTSIGRIWFLTSEEADIALKKLMENIK